MCIKQTIYGIALMNADVSLTFYCSNLSIDCKTLMINRVDIKFSEHDSTRFFNNLHHIPSKPIYWKTKSFKSLWEEEH